MNKLALAAVRLLVAVLVLGLGSLGTARAQVPNYMLPKKTEKPKETKPPGTLEPGPQGTSKHGWGNVKKNPGAKGSQNQRWQTGKPLDHSTPSKPKDPSRQFPQETKAPKGPPQPKGPRSSPEMDFEKPDPAKTPAASPATAKPISPASPSDSD
jgi:hypothetical protein